VRTPASSVAAAVLVLAAEGVAQEPPPAPPSTLAEAEWHGPLVPAGHWTRGVLARLDDLGWLPGGDPRGDGWTRGEVVAVLGDILDSVRLERPRPAASALVESLALGARERLLAEIGSAAGDPGHRIRTVGFFPGIGWRGVEGALDAGFDTAAAGPPVDPVPRRGGAETEVTARITVVPIRWVAAEAVPSVGETGVRLRSGHVALRLGAAVAWAGRRRPGTGGNDGDDLILAYDGALDGGGVALRGSERMGGPLRWLGPVSASAVVARLPAVGATEDAWLARIRLGARPHRRVTLGLERAALVGGPGLSPWALFRTAVGAQGEDPAVDNQALAASARLRLEPAGTPMTVRATLAMDDASGAWRDVPGHVLGVGLPAIPGAPRLALELERTEMARSCCGNPAWYRHLSLPWLAGRSLLGHPLGGHGREWRLSGRWDARPGRASAHVAGFRRWRGEENLLAPARAGRSTGATLRVDAGDGRLEGAGRITVEAGDGWFGREISLRLRLRL
jgi:hypothetical protein